MLMVDAAREDGLMPFAIGNCHIAQLYLVGNHHHGVASQLIGGVQRGNGGIGIYHQISCEVDIVECASYAGITFGMPCDLAEERLGVTVHEIDIGAVGADIEVDGVVDG